MKKSSRKAAASLPKELDAYCVTLARAYKRKPETVRRDMAKAVGEVTKVMKVFGQLLDYAVAGKELPDETMRLLRRNGIVGAERHRAVPSRPRAVL